MNRFRYWLIPDLLRLTNEDYRWMVYVHAVKHIGFQWWTAASMLLPSLVIWFPPQIRIVQDPLWNTVLKAGLCSFAWVIGGLVMFGLGFTLFRSSIRRRARDYMRRHYQVNICVPCGYDLTGNTSGVCSECGEKIDAGQRAASSTVRGEES